MAAQTGKKGRPSKAELERRKRIEALEQQKKQRQQYIALALFAFALLLTALAFFEGQSVWSTLHAVLFGVFGILAYIVGPLLFYFAFAFALGKTPPVPRMLKALFLLLCVSGAIYIFSKDPPSGDFAVNIPELYQVGTTKAGGGVLSALLGWTLYALAGPVAAKIVIVILALVALMLMTGKTLLDLIDGTKETGEKLKEKRRIRQEERAELEALAAKDKPSAVTEAEAKFDIDVSLGDRGKTSASIDIPLDDVRGATMPPDKTSIDLPLAELRAAKKRRPASADSRIDIPLGPEFSARNPLDIDLIEGKKRPAAATGPAADVVEEVFERNRRVSEIFTDFGDAPPLDELIGRASRAPEKPSARSAQSLPEPPLAEYRFPPLSFLEKPKSLSKKDITAELRANAEALVATLDSFGVHTRVVDISRGPTVTRYELQPEAGVRLSRIVNLSDDLALNLAAMGVRIEAPIPGKAAVGIEVPNKEQGTVALREVLESELFRSAASPLSIAMGVDISGGIQIGDIGKMPHLLIAGSTGMGKSVFINSMIISLIYKSSPEDLQLMLIDPKMVEFTVYRGLPHLPVAVVTDPGKAAGALNTALAEMLRRYKTFANFGVRNIEEYNALVARDYGADYLPEPDEEVPVKKARWVIVIDELADLMMTAPRDVENAICRIAQMGRAAGIHLVVATQRPSVDVITGTIKNNIPTRVAFRVSSQVDSRTILDGPGAEKLIGRGDMLFQAVGQPKPVRIQGCYISEEEVARVVAYVKKYAAAQYNEELMREIEQNAVVEKGAGGGESGDRDPMLEEAIEVVVEVGQASTSLLQRKLKLGYARAARIMDEMEEKGIVGPSEGSKPRAVLLSRQQWQERLLNRAD